MLSLNTQFTQYRESSNLWIFFGFQRWICSYNIVTPMNFIDSLMNIDVGYAQTKTAERIKYEENVHDANKK